MWQIAVDNKELQLPVHEVVDQLVRGIDLLADRKDIQELVGQVVTVAQESGDLQNMSPAAVAQLLFVLGYQYKTMLVKNTCTYNGEPVGRPRT